MKSRHAGILGIDILDAALSYAARGWRVFPVCAPTPNACTHEKPCGDIGKRPHIDGWPKNATSDAETIRRWWRKWPDANIGIATGAISGIFAVDVDGAAGEASLAELVDKHGALPATVESRTGRMDGGRHLLFEHPNGRHVRNVSDDSIGKGVHIRGDGGFIVAPPSRHRSGNAYTWELSSDPESTPVADAPAWLVELVTERPEKTETTETTDIHLSALSALSVTDAIMRTLPQWEGQRNSCIFRLAWMLKSMPAYRDKPVSDLRDIVREWHRQALPIIATKAFDVTWADFVHAWPRIKHVVGDGPFEKAVARADAAEDPPEAAKYESDKTRRLIRLSRELQHEHGGKPFYLSSRKAAELLDTDRSSASRTLRMLCADGVLELVELGPRGGGKASRYRYVQPSAVAA